MIDPVSLPFDADTMLAGLRPWVECESPTWDAAAVDRMLALAARDMAMSGASIETIAGGQGFGGCIRARFPHPSRMIETLTFAPSCRGVSCYCSFD